MAKRSKIKENAKTQKSDDNKKTQFTQNVSYIDVIGAKITISLEFALPLCDND